MRNILVSLVALFLSFSLVACSTNTQSQNTGIGAVSGAVVGGLAGSLIGAGAGKVVAVGVGAIAGALIGGAIGHSMQSSDTARMDTALNNNPPNQPAQWVNPNTHTTYVMTPTSHYFAMDGYRHCRHYRTVAIIDGVKHYVYGTACRRANGTWIAVNP